MCGRYVVFTDEENAELIEIINGIDQRYKNEAQQMKTGEILPTDTVPVITAKTGSSVGYGKSAGSAASQSILGSANSASITSSVGAAGSISSAGSYNTVNAHSTTSDNHSERLFSPENLMDVHLFRWGFPNYMKSSAVIINARCETLHEKPTFRKLLGTGRCLVPASGFYEWKAAGVPAKKKDKYLIRAAESKLMYFAGLYGSFIDKTGIPSTRFVIITTEANRQMSQIHSRMPVILRKSEALAWISPENKDLNSLLRPYDSELTFDRVG